MALVIILFGMALLGFVVLYARENLKDTELPVRYHVYRIKGYKKCDNEAFTIIPNTVELPSITIGDLIYIHECTFIEEKNAKRYVEHWEN